MKAQQLKNSILQLAIQGKLVPQDPNAEPASELIKRIRKEKEQLIKEGKIKKDKNPSYIFRGSDNLPYEKVGKNEPVCISEEVPFDIPDSWEWIRLGSITEIARGGSPRPIKDYLTTPDKGVHWIKIGDTSKGSKYIDSTAEYILPSGISNSRMIHKGDFLLTNSMSFGIPYISNIDGCIHDGWLVISNLYSAFYMDFLYYLLSSRFAYYQFCQSVSGAVVKNLNSDKVANALIPVPPLSEQQRIVEKIEQLLPYIEEYDNVEQKNTKLDLTFPDLLKKSILQEAIQGKLVPQNPNDEPASELIKKIQAEKEQLIKEKKIKKDKNESFIFRRDNSHYENVNGIEHCIDNEISFEIPVSWAWVRLGNVVYNSGQKKPENTFSYIDIGSIDNKNNKLNCNENIILPENAPSRARKIVQSGDILYSTVRPYLHNICIIDKEFTNEPIASTGFAVITCTKGIFNKFLFYYLLSPTFDVYANDNENSKGVAYPAINDEKFYKGLIALPPIKEQQRIVEKIENLLPSIDNLKM